MCMTVSGKAALLLSYSPTAATRATGQDHWHYLPWCYLPLLLLLLPLLLLLLPWSQSATGLEATGAGTSQAHRLLNRRT